MLHVYVDTKDDKLQVAANRAPLTLKLRLKRYDEYVANQVYLKGMDLMSKGMVLDPDAGHFCSGFPSIATGFFVTEQNLNHFDANGALFGRARLVTVCDSERVKKFALFRERASDLSMDLFPSTTGPAAGGDFVSTQTEEDLETLCGEWRVMCTRLQVTQKQLGVSKEEYTLRTYMVDRTIITEGKGLSFTGNVSADGKAVTFADGNSRRMVFLGGGMTATTSTLVPKGGGVFFIEFAWLVERALRLRIVRRYEGSSWVETCFVREVRVAG